LSSGSSGGGGGGGGGAKVAEFTPVTDADAERDVEPAAELVAEPGTFRPTRRIMLSKLDSISTLSLSIP
jgi:hypothetical protein